MSSQESSAAGPSHRLVEIGVAIAIMASGGLVMMGSVQAGIGWGAEGPKAGFFPFYIGLAIVISSVINLWSAYRESESGLFAEWGQLRQVMAVVIPTTIYVAAIPFIGLYVSSVLLIGFFMRWLGKYNWLLIAAVAIGMPLLTYIVFEKWFLVPLPKGPLEEWLGL
jgi:putative tricarboxylic transport membrane protein